MQTPHTWRELIDQLLIRKGPFFAVFFVVTFVTYALLYAIDFYPEPVTTTASSTAETIEEGATSLADESEDNEQAEPFRVTITENEAVTESDQSDIAGSDSAQSTDDAANSAPGAAYIGPGVTPVLPSSMYIERLDRTVPVLNPQSRAIDDLDQALLSGAVRHPDSADLANTGNIFILGHSSYLPNVLNRNFQAFNGIQSLEWGDRIVLQTPGQKFVYRVERVYEAQAADVIVPHTPGDARLTLATCDSFGSKDDRFIVEARLVGSPA